ncbi:MAG: hypothetical protein SXQ77_04910, partial [Halobacteria archaeon]|nr:hypothetical protein [Halobacteria archaeon]
MKRRDFTKTVGIGVLGLGSTLALAGCMDGNGNSNGEGNASDNGGGNETSGNGENGGKNVEIQNTNFEVTSRQGGNQVNEANIQTKEDEMTVVVEGTIWGSNGCKT